MPKYSSSEGAPTRKTHVRSLEGMYKRLHRRAAMLNSRHNANTETTEVTDDIDQLVGIPTDNEKLSELLSKVLPSLTPTDSPCTDPSKRLVYRYMDASETLGRNHTTDVMCRFPNVLSDAAKQDLLSKWRWLKASRPVYHDKKKTHPNGTGRSMTGVLHTGIWSVRQDHPVITTDSRMQPKRVLPLMREFNQAIQRWLGPLIEGLMKVYFPEQLAMNRRARHWVSSQLHKNLKEFPECDFGEGFFTAAVKEGVSELLHVDWNDHPNSITWVVALWDGDWEGGDLWVPQLDTCIPVQCRDAVSISTRHLAHCGTEITAGNRLVFTLFSDRTLLQHGTR